MSKPDYILLIVAFFLALAVAFAAETLVSLVKVLQ